MSIRWWRQYPFEDSLFRKYIDSTHQLVRLADNIDWQRIYKALSPYYSTDGLHAIDIRLMLGLHILKHRYDVSDEVGVKMLLRISMGCAFLAYCTRPSPNDKIHHKRSPRT